MPNPAGANQRAAGRTPGREWAGQSGTVAPHLPDSEASEPPRRRQVGSEEVLLRWGGGRCSQPRRPSRGGSIRSPSRTASIHQRRDLIDRFRWHTNGPIQSWKRRRADVTQPCPIRRLQAASKTVQAGSQHLRRFLATAEPRPPQPTLLDGVSLPDGFWFWFW